MKYKVNISRLARVDLRGALAWASQHAPRTAALWSERFEDAIQTLAKYPHRCQLALEARKCQREVRQYLYGKRPNVYRAVFEIDEDTVFVLRVLRAQRRPLTRKQIDEARESGEGS